MPPIPTNDPAIFALSLTQLNAYKTQVGQAHKGRFVQIFLGLKLFQNTIPSMFSGQFVSTEVLQTALDDLYAKQSRPANACVLMPFEGTFLARTGLIAPGNRTPQNTWRNNFNLQKGVGCYAPPVDLTSPTFLSQSRLDCRHLRPAVQGSLNGARCALSPTGASYRNEDHPKWLQIDPGGNGYAVVDLQNIPNFQGTVAPGGNRIPLLPLIAALYYDATPGLLANRPSGVDIADFMTDFSISAVEAQAYFDVGLTNPFNSAISAAIDVPRVITPAPVPTLAQNRAPVIAQGTPRVPLLSATPVAPPAVNSGWPAEEFVREALNAHGWTTFSVSRQQLGYDLLGQKGHRTVYFEVKSSLGYCTPRLTEREWQQAVRLGRDYVMAIVENYNPTGANGVYWISNPAAVLVPSVSLVRQFGISRNSWHAAAIPVTQI